MSALTKWCRYGSVECPHCGYDTEWPAKYLRMVPDAPTPAEGDEIECDECYATLKHDGHDIFDGADGGPPSGAWIWTADISDALSLEDVAQEREEREQEERIAARELAEERAIDNAIDTMKERRLNR